MATRSNRKFVQLMLNQFVNIDDLLTLSKFFIVERKRLNTTYNVANDNENLDLEEEKALSKIERDLFFRIYKYLELTQVIENSPAPTTS
ncbi:unnamed protein product [Adineta steineri]|uniref:Uncharacterized protein n=1 Tax=Adineta steineri TaxID=433720 RepID=A0A815QSH0_9BILA|nr:unnamed protein product [Adineta steineri]CAF1467550.1 unnamed protein product [Adineta steineri]CAF3587591.1 unnamed protein product [Adineta steineri]CAF3787360.1 unnamed protein product [Adineta steineri]